MSIADFVVVSALALSLAAFGGAAWCTVRWRGWWRIATSLPIAVLVAWTASLLLGWPAEHTLWPFELLLLGPVALLYLAIVWLWRDSVGPGDDTL